MRDKSAPDGTLDRRTFVKAALAPASLTLAHARQGRVAEAGDIENAPPEDGPAIIDTNVHLFQWPFRRLKYDATDALVRKLRRHKVATAWAGSFEAVFQKQLDLVNRRLAEECRARGGGVLVPIGSVNPAWPAWEEDLARCHEQYGMAGVRLYPGYHGYGLGEREFAEVLSAATARRMFVQVVVRMEDERVHHPSVIAPAVSVSPLADVVAKVPRARVQLLNADTVFRSGHVGALIERTPVAFDISAVEGNGGISRLMAGTQPNYRGAVPVERLLFGSHAPFFPFESALLRLFESALERSQIELLMHANAMRFLDTSA